MPLRNGIPLVWKPHGVSDAADGTNSFPGAMRALRNLIPDPSTSDVWMPRPPAVLITDFADFTTPGFISAFLIIGNTLYGMIASGLNTGHDQPFVYDLLADTFTTVSGITAGNTPTSPATTGAWTPPIMAQVAGRIIVTHPGFPGDQIKFGWFDISGFSQVVIGDIVTGSFVMTGNPSIFGIQPGMSITSAGTTAAIVASVANAYTGIAFTGDSHTTNTIDGISSTAGMFVGMIVTGPGIQAATTIAQIIGGTSILLSRPTTSTVAAGDFFVAAPSSTSANGTYAGTQTPGSATITLADTTNLWVGQLISGNGIPLGSSIVSIVANTSITISQLATASGLQPFNVTGAVILMTTAAANTFDGMPAIIAGGTVAAPLWGAGDTQINNLPSVPVGVAQMNGRAWFACGTDGVVFSDSGIPCQISNSPRVQALTTGDGLAVTAVAPQSLASLLGGQVQAIIAFEGTFRMQQITGDPSTNNLAMNALPVATGTDAPLTLGNSEHGLSFVSPEGLRFVTVAGTITAPVGDAGQGVTTPFIYSVVPSRMCAATNSHTIRITTQNGLASGDPQEEYWYDLGRKVWCGPHSSTASLIEGWGAETFVMTFVGENATLYNSIAVPEPSANWLERGNPLQWQYMPVLLPDNMDMAMNALVEMTIMCGGPDCDPTAPPEPLIYSPASNGGTPILPPFVMGSAAAMTLANATLSATGTQVAPFVCPGYSAAVQLARLDPTPSLGSVVWGITSDGSQMVGADYDTVPHQVPVVWTSNGTVVTALTMPATYITGIAYGISPDGLTIVGTVSTTADGSGGIGTHPKACVWNSGVPTVLAPLGALDQAAARCVSDDGTKIGGFSWPNGGSFLPTAWASGTPTQLTGGGGGDGTIYGCDSTGTIFVGDLTGFSNPKGITVWRSGVAENPDLGGWSVSSPGTTLCGISRDGNTVTTSAADLTGHFHAVEWKYASGAWGALIDLNGAGTDYIGDAISPDGNIVVGRQFGGAPEYVPTEFCGGAVTTLTVTGDQGTEGSDIMTGVAADNSKIIGEIFDATISQNTAAFWPVV